VSHLGVDVLIVGAGPAGSTLASLLAAEGIKGMVVDRAAFPRAKPCGECVNPGAVAMLRRLGVLDRVMECDPARITGWHLTTASGAAAVGRYEEGDYGLGIPRIDFDHVLLNHARQRGATIHERTHVVDVRARVRGGYTVWCRTGDAERFGVDCRFLVGADGLRSVVARRLGLLRRTPRLRKLSITCRLRWCGSTGHAGTLRLADGYTVGLAPVHASARLWNATVVIPSAHWSARAIDLLPIYAQRIAHLQDANAETMTIVDGPWTSGPFDWSVRAAATSDALLIGDAAGYFDPLTGQGICQALKTAEFASEAIRDAVNDEPNARRPFSRYNRRVVRLQAPVRLFQRVVERVIQQKDLRNAFIRHLHESERYADRLVRFAGDVLPLAGLGRLDLLRRAG